MDILQSIMAERRRDVEATRHKVPIETLRNLASGRTHHSLTQRLRCAFGTCVIAEIKKASPSAGLLRKDYRPEEIARAYKEAGATGISVLTEPRHFLGSDQHLRNVRKAVDLPVLRKDFLCDIYQVYESAALGADVVLLIVAALDRSLLCTLYEEAVKCGLDVLVEVHTGWEIEVALDLERAIVGINSRDLKTLSTNLSVARELARSIPPDRLSIAESGIRKRADIEELEALGYNGFLVGEALMGEKDPGARLRELLIPGNNC